MGKNYPVMMQENAFDCGISCLISCFWYYHLKIKKEDVYNYYKPNNKGISLYDLTIISKKFKVEATGVKGDVSLLNNKKLPCIAHVIKDKKYFHYVVVYQVTKDKVYYFDPEIGFLTVSIKEFNKISTKVFLLLKPPDQKESYNQNEDLFKYIKIVFNTYKPFILKHLFFTVFLLGVTLLFSYYIQILLRYEKETISMLFLIFIVFFHLALVKIFLNFQKNKITSFFRSKFHKDLHKTFLNHLFKLSSSQYNKINISLYEEDIVKIEDLTVEIFFDILPNVLLFFLISIFFAIYHLGYFGLFLIFFILLILFTSIFRTQFFSSYYRLRKERITYHSYLYEVLDNVLSIKRLLIDNYVKSFLEKIRKRWMREEENNRFLIMYFQVGLNLIMDMFYLIFFFFGIILLQKDILDFYDYLLFASLFSFISQLVPNILYMISNSLVYQVSFRRFFDFFNISNLKTYYLEEQVKTISFVNITYLLEDRLLFNDLSLDILKGQYIFLGGSSGVGKTMLMKLLLQEEVNYDGHIYLNNQVLSKESKMINNGEIIYTSLNDFILEGTLYDAFLPCSVSLKRIKKACLVSKVSKIFNDDIDFNFLILKNGSNLSSGQKSRIILARALLKASNILILDELLSSLPISDERDILINIKKNYPNLTVIFISHRRNNFDLFDKIYNLEGGKIYEKVK